MLVTGSGSVKKLPFQVDSLNWGVTIPANGSAIVRDSSGGYYLVSATGNCSKLNIP
jgi:hypothetical protein